MVALQGRFGTDNGFEGLGALAATMGKLTSSQIDEYFAIHLPYRTRILLAHYRMTRRPWIGDLGQLEAAFEASLITGRMYLNILGISKNRRDVLVRPRIEPDDVSAVDLGGTSPPTSTRATLRTPSRSTAVCGRAIPCPAERGST